MAEGRDTRQLGDGTMPLLHEISGHSAKVSDSSIGQTTRSMPRLSPMHIQTEVSRLQTQIDLLEKQLLEQGVYKPEPPVSYDISHAGHVISTNIPMTPQRGNNVAN